MFIRRTAGPSVRGRRRGHRRRRARSASVRAAVSRPSCMTWTTGVSRNRTTTSAISRRWHRHQSDSLHMTVVRTRSVSPRSASVARRNSSDRVQPAYPRNDSLRHPTSGESGAGRRNPPSRRSQRYSMPASGSHCSSAYRATCGWRRLPGAIRTSTTSSIPARCRIAVISSCVAVPCPNVNSVIVAPHATSRHCNVVAAKNGRTSCS